MSGDLPELPEAEPVTVEYAHMPPDARNGMAVAALVVGVLALPTYFTGLSVLLGFIAIVLGIGALVRAWALPRHIGRGMAIAGVVCGIAGVVVGGFVLAHPFRGPGISKRAICASNLRGIGQGMKVYANDNNDWFPTTPFKEMESDAGSAMAVSFVGQLGANLMRPLTPGEESRVHPSRALFMPVTDGTCTAKQFICPNSKDAEDDLRNGAGSTARAAQPGVNRFDFRGYGNLSYGYQLPFGPHARPSEKLDPRMAIMADKGPFFEAGTPTAGGVVPDKPVASLPPGMAITLPGLTSADALMKAVPSAWRPYNSRNHGGEGQNVLFMDGHVEFLKRPIVGVDNDNIYTQQGGLTREAILLGRSPQDLQGPLTETDSIIVP
jgi:prepilin-type processing-associated H-X9-DG protein